MAAKESLVKLRKTLEHHDRILMYKKRMLVWDNPVEYVNNMYGCHPNEVKMEYFDKIYEKKGK